jgi:YMGG-like Gly-zipper
MRHTSFVLALLLLASTFALSQQAKDTTGTSAGVTASLNKSLGVFIFPAKDQKPEQQASDEQACYSWAVKQSGVDPLNMKAAKPDTVAKGADGSAVKGAAKGAVAGVAIGAIAGDAGKGAAIGAAAGGMKGASGRKQKEAKKEEENKKAAEAKNQQAVDSFKKAYSACLEGKGYSVK